MLQISFKFSFLILVLTTDRCQISAFFFVQRLIYYIFFSIVDVISLFPSNDLKTTHIFLNKAWPHTFFSHSVYYFIWKYFYKNLYKFNWIFFFCNFYWKRSICLSSKLTEIKSVYNTNLLFELIELLKLWNSTRWLK